MNSRVLLNVSYLTCFIQGPRDTCLAADEVGTRGGAALLEPTGPRKLGTRVASLETHNVTIVTYSEHENLHMDLQLLPETAGGRKAGTPPWARSCKPGPGCSDSSPW